MKLTNKFKLPQTLMNVHDIQRQEYSKGEARMSVTQLIRSPRIDILRQRHYEEIEEDISDRLWAVLGTVIHNIMEKGADEQHIGEERLSVELAGWIISGGIDVQRIGNRAKLYDYKFTKAIKFMLQDFKDWEEQLNCYAYLVRVEKGWEIEGLEVCMFVRDFTKTLADTNKDYPPAPCIPIAIKLWTEEQQKNFLLRRIAAHKNALRCASWGDPLPFCTDEERWKRDSDWAVMKGQNKRASRVFQTNQECMDWVTNQKDDDGNYSIIEREDTPTRCKDNYCGVNKWCDQWQAEKDRYDS